MTDAQSWASVCSELRCTRYCLGKNDHSPLLPLTKRQEYSLWIFNTGVAVLKCITKTSLFILVQIVCGVGKLQAREPLPSVRLSCMCQKTVKEGGRILAVLLRKEKGRCKKMWVQARKLDNFEWGKSPLKGAVSSVTRTFHFRYVSP